MHLFWDTIIEPLLRALDARRILEIGSDEGHNTRHLLDYCQEVDGFLEVVDPLPKYDPEIWFDPWPGRVGFHRDLSLNVLSQIKPVDVALIDGDHNWYTVYHELKLIDKAARQAGQPFPLVLLHDVGWPYGRRDLYYDPDTIPLAYRKPYRKQGIQYGVASLAEHGGLNPHLHNGIYEHNLQNGVLSAVEDFIDEAGADMRFVFMPGIHGLGILYPSALEERDVFQAFMLELLPTLRQRRFMEMLEEQRLRLLVQDAEQSRDLRSLQRRHHEQSAQLTEVRNNADELAKRLDIAASDQTSLKEQLQTAATEHTALKEQLRAAATERTVLKEQLQTATTERTALDEQLQAAVTERAALSEHLLQSERTRENLSRQLSKSEAERIALSRQLTDLKADLADARVGAQQTANLKGQLAEARKQNAQQERQLADSSKQGSQLERQLADARKQGSQLERQLADSRKQGSQLERQLADARKQGSQLERQLADARRHGDQSSALLARYRRCIEQIEQDYQAIRASARWRIGHRLVRILEVLLLRGKPRLVMDQMGERLAAARHWASPPAAAPIPRALTAPDPTGKL